MPPKNCLTTMRRVTLAAQKVCYLLLILCCSKIGTTQTLRLQDFAIWGGSAASSPYNSAQGVTINNTATILGNVGTNHLLISKNNINVTGSMYSGNLISFNNYAKITGIFPQIDQNYSESCHCLSEAGTRSPVTTANGGKITFGTYGRIIGQVECPLRLQLIFRASTFFRIHE
jgi:hypothetical protein